jgi:hypothetical protein
MPQMRVGAVSRQLAVVLRLLAATPVADLKRCSSAPCASVKSKMLGTPALKRSAITKYVYELLKTRMVEALKMSRE